MKKWHEAAILLLIVLVAAILRLTAIDWDDYNHYHPDERYIAWVATSIESPRNWGTAFKPHQSPFNPYYWPKESETDGIALAKDEPRRFAYGHFPLYLGVAATRVLEFAGPSLSQVFPESWLLTTDLLNPTELIEFGHIAAVGRVLAALFDVATVVMIYFLGRWLFSSMVGLLSAAFLALNVMHIQLSHFFVVDPFLTFFAVSSIALMIISLKRSLSQRRRLVFLILASIIVGLAIGSKFSAVLLMLPLSLTVLFNQDRSRRARLIMLLAVVVISFISFSVTNPFAIIDWTCDVDSPAIGLGPLEIPLPELSSCYAENLVLQGTMVRGTRDVPFARQYLGTDAYFYFVEMQLRWGMGYLLGLAAFAGFAWAIWRVVKLLYRWWKDGERPRTYAGLNESIDHSKKLNIGPFGVSRGELVVLSWTVPFFLTTGALMVKFMRYLEPLTPFLMLYAAAMLLSLPWKRARRVLIAIVLLAAGVRAVSFVNMYSQPHPWIAASGWIYENIEPESSILNEIWDDPLPDSLEINGDMRLRGEFNASTVNWLSGVRELDSQQKIEENLALVAGADYVILSSNRNYGVIPRLEELYPLSSQYYHLLFDGRLGFDVAYIGTRTPKIFGLSLKPDTFSWPGLATPVMVEDFFSNLPGLDGGRVDESFTVYDQPLVIILKNTGMLSAQEMGELIDYS
jgi:4-amino-4-deoxy-L-arabinose transferase-like glycosyltransferase